MRLLISPLGGKSNVSGLIQDLPRELQWLTVTEGDQRRPVCSRCHEGGYSCIYSSAKKKPGPARGTQKTGRRSARPVGKPAQPPDGSDLDSVERGSGSLPIADINSFGMESPAAAGTIFSNSDVATGSIALASDLAPITPPVGTSRYLELGVSSDIQAKLQVPPSFGLFRCFGCADNIT